MADAGFIALTLTVSKEGKQFVSRCEELGTASCGDTVDEALENIKDATMEYLNTIERLGQRDRIFEEKGITVRKTRPTLVPLPHALHPGSIASPYVTKIPVAV
jgi:predicted RNase H-like HicB family nuclease